MDNNVPVSRIVSEGESKLCPDKAPEIAPQSPLVVFSPYEPVDQNDSIEEIQRKDLALTNDVLNALYASWGTVRSVAGVCMLANMTLKTIEARRKVLNKPFGEPERLHRGKILPI